MQRIIVRALVVGTMLVSLSACGFFGGDEMEQRREQGDLRLPPDLGVTEDPLALRVPEAESAAELEAREAVLPQSRRVSVTRFGDQRWITVRRTPARVYAQISDFLEDQGVEVAFVQPATGLIETDWLYTARPFGRGVFAPRLESVDAAQVADRYLIRVERGEEADTADVVVAHRRIARDREDEWRLLGADPFLEAELLRSLAVYFGVRSEDSVRALTASEDVSPPARLGEDDRGEPVFDIDQSIVDVWQRVGLALDRAVFTVTERNRDERYYAIRYDTVADAERPDEGMLSSLAFWREDVPETLSTYHLTLSDTATGTRLALESPDGDPAPRERAEDILALIASQLR